MTDKFGNTLKIEDRVIIKNSINISKYSEIFSEIISYIDENMGLVYLTNKNIPNSICLSSSIAFFSFEIEKIPLDATQEYINNRIMILKLES